MNEFFGKPISYWVEVQKQILNLNLEDQIFENAKIRSEYIEEIANLRRKVSFYESRIKDMNRIMDSD